MEGYYVLAISIFSSIFGLIGLYMHHTLKFKREDRGFRYKEKVLRTKKQPVSEVKERSLKDKAIDKLIERFAPALLGSDEDQEEGGIEDNIINGIIEGLTKRKDQDEGGGGYG